MTIVVRQNGVDVPVKVQRMAVQRPIVSTQRLPGDIAYIRVESFFQLDQAGSAASSARTDARLQRLHH